MQATVNLTPGTGNLMEFSVRYVSTKNMVAPGSFRAVINIREIITDFTVVIERRHVV